MNILIRVKISSVVYSIQENIVNEHTQTHSINIIGSPGNQIRIWKVTHLAERFHVSRPTIYDVLKRAGLQEFMPRDSINQRFKTLQYGLKRLAKVEQTTQERLKREATRYNSLTRVNSFTSIPSGFPF